MKCVALMTYRHSNDISRLDDIIIRPDGINIINRGSVLLDTISMSLPE